jgi:hypothetical protein
LVCDFVLDSTWNLDLACVINYVSDTCRVVCEMDTVLFT